MPVRCIACAKLFPEKKMVGELCKRCLKGKSSHQRKADKFQKKINKVMGQSSGKSEVNVNQNTTPAEPTASYSPPESPKLAWLTRLYQVLYQPSPNEDIYQGKLYWFLGSAILVGGGGLGFFTMFAEAIDVDDFGMWPLYFILIGLGGAAIFIPLALYKFGMFKGFWTPQKIIWLIFNLICGAIALALAWNKD